MDHAPVGLDGSYQTDRLETRCAEALEAIEDLVEKRRAIADQGRQSEPPAYWPDTPEALDADQVF
jgi:hypothetical protein